MSARHDITGEMSMVVLRGRGGNARKPVFLSRNLPPLYHYTCSMLSWGRVSLQSYVRQCEYKQGTVSCKDQTGQFRAPSLVRKQQLIATVSQVNISTYT